MISRGLASAASTMTSLVPLFRVLVVSLAPFLSYCRVAACSITRIISPLISSSAIGDALSSALDNEGGRYHLNFLDLTLEKGDYTYLLKLCFFIRAIRSSYRPLVMYLSLLSPHSIMPVISGKCLSTVSLVFWLRRKDLPWVQK